MSGKKTTHDLLDEIEKIKTKITDEEYKTITESLKDIHISKGSLWEIEYTYPHVFLSHINTDNSNNLLTVNSEDTTMYKKTVWFDQEDEPCQHRLVSELPSLKSFLPINIFCCEDEETTQITLLLKPSLIGWRRIF